ncbi:hypothetical protein [Psychromonas sp. SP041]|uniref:hypothetical protein n=1 Tax=Psychromonas sp. SP041 TaxID=1365007 RepID=UPI000422F9AF|nr:hypothetical protein [Psychromonas sp. SP041]
METKRKALPITPFKVMGNQYVSPMIYFDGNKKSISASVQDIPNLDEIIVNNEVLSFSILFPFNKESEFTIYPTDKGFSRLLIINEIRRAYRAVFRHNQGTSARWETVTTKGGIQSFLVDYPLKGLYVEKILISEKDNRLYITTECAPEIKRSDSLPF